MAIKQRVPQGDIVSMSTCALWGGKVTPSATTGKFDMEEVGYRCKTIGSGAAMSAVDIVIPAIVAGDIDDIATQISTQLYIDTTDFSDPIKQRFDPDFTEADIRTLIPLSSIVHLNNVDVDSAEPTIALGTNVANQVHDKFPITKFIITGGNEIVGISGFMQWESLIGVGQARGRSADDAGGTANPNSPVLPAVPTIEFTHVLGASGVAIPFNTSTTVNPNLWDDNSGSAIPIANPGEASIMRIYQYAGNEYILMLGQETFTTFAIAQAAEGDEDFIEPPVLSTAIHVYSIIIEKTAADSLDATKVDLRKKFR